MKKIIILLSIFIAVQSVAQDKLNVVQQAMRDELERNMKELKADGFDRPFFLNYSILDQHNVQITATLGALMSSVERDNRAAQSIRLLVGDYDFNDESLDNNLFSQPQANELSLPLDDDYLGIRRSLWISTDNVYRNASRQFAKNKEMLKEQNKPLAELPHRSFAKVPPSKIDISLPEFKFDKSATEDYVRRLSAVFAGYRTIQQSNVSFFCRWGYRYLVNSEGSINRIPDLSMSLRVGAGFRTSTGEFVVDNIHHNYATIELPPIEAMIAEVKAMAERMIASGSSPVFREEYSGPALFIGQPVAQLFVSELFGGEEGLAANNNIQSLTGYRYESNSLDAKIGKPVFADGMTVKAMPKLKKYGDVTLLGSFEVDEEGVVPADETVLIENGVLKVLMNDRTIVNAGQVANGLGDGPGVVSVTFKTSLPAVDLKARLIAQAKKEGLEYGLIIRERDAGMRVMDVWKVYVDDGREELARQASMKSLSQRSFRKISDVSGEVAVHNISSGARSLISVICPEAVLLSEVEFESTGFPTIEEEEYVPSPLKK